MSTKMITNTYWLGESAQICHCTFCMRYSEYIPTNPLHHYYENYDGDDDNDDDDQSYKNNNKCN